jgi:hypothetical protein
MDGGRVILGVAIGRNYQNLSHNREDYLVRAKIAGGNDDG